MNNSRRDFEKYPWCVAKADSPYNGNIRECKTFIGACYVALVYRLAGWQVFIFKYQSNQPDGISLQEAVQIAKLMKKARARK